MCGFSLCRSHNIFTTHRLIYINFKICGILENFEYTIKLWHETLKDIASIIYSCRIISHAARPTLHVNTNVMMQTVLYSCGLSVRTTCHLNQYKKMCFKKVQKLKKVCLRRGLNPQMSWVTIVCVHGFDRNVALSFSLHQCLQYTVKNEQKQLSVSNQHFRVPR